MGVREKECGQGIYWCDNGHIWWGCDYNYMEGKLVNFQLLEDYIKGQLWALIYLPLLWMN